MICFCYFCQKSLPFWAWPIMGSKKQFLRGFTNYFSELLDATHVIDIESPNIFHWKSPKKVKWVWSLGQNLGQIGFNVVKKKTKKRYFNGFFSYFAWGIHLQLRSMVIEIAEWKLKAIFIARNTIFDGSLDKLFAHFCVKNCQKWLF